MEIQKIVTSQDLLKPTNTSGRVKPATLRHEPGMANLQGNRDIDSIHFQQVKT